MYEQYSNPNNDIFHLFCVCIGGRIVFQDKTPSRRCYTGDSDEVEVCCKEQYYDQRPRTRLLKCWNTLNLCNICCENLCIIKECGCVK